MLPLMHLCVNRHVGVWISAPSCRSICRYVGQQSNFGRRILVLLFLFDTSVLDLLHPRLTGVVEDLMVSIGVVVGVLIGRLCHHRHWMASSLWAPMSVQSLPVSGSGKK